MRISPAIEGMVPENHRQNWRLPAIAVKLPSLTAWCNRFREPSRVGCKVASTQNMAELQHDRAPDRAATQGIAFDRGKLLAAGAAAFIRLWSNRENDPPSEPLFKNLDPAVCLAADLMIASGGTAVPTHGRLLSFAFSGAEAAILASRRLQWAFQGLSEADQFAGTAAAILVHSREDLPNNATDESFAVVLEKAAPGQILFGEKASQILDGLPGLVTETAAELGLRQLLWRHPGTESNSSADERTLFRNIKEQGSGDTGPSKEPVSDARTESPGSTEANPSETSVYGNSIVHRLVGKFPQLRDKASWMMWCGSAAVALCLVGLVSIALHRRPHLPPPPNLPPPSKLDSGGSPSPQNPQGSSTISKISGFPTSKPGISIAKPRERAPLNTRQSKLASEPPKEEQSAAGCDLGSAGIPRTLARAQKNLHAGKLGDAQRDFQSILACDRTNGQAQEGMRLVRELRGASK